MVTGTHAFSGRTELDIGVQVLQGRPPAPSKLAPGVPRSVDRIVARAMAKRPRNATRAPRSWHPICAGRPPTSRRKRAGTSRRCRICGRRGRGGAPRCSGRCSSPLAALGCGPGGSRSAKRGRIGSAAVRNPSSPSCPTTFRQPTSRGRTRREASPRISPAGLRASGAITVIGGSSVRASVGRPPQAMAAAVGARLALSGSLRPLDDEWTSLENRHTADRGGDGRVLWTDKPKERSAGPHCRSVAITRTSLPGSGLRTASAADHSRARCAWSSRRLRQVPAGPARRSPTYDASRAVQLLDAAAIADPSLIEAQAGLAEALYRMSAFEGRGAVRRRADPRQTRRRGRLRHRPRPGRDASLPMGLTSATAREALPASAAGD